MDPLSRLDSYFRSKERAKLELIRAESSTGLPEMTPAEIRQSCRENNGYETPELNDKLYLHFRGFKRIENLEPYTGCKAIWLDSNGFEQIEGLSQLTQLRCLYLAKNLIADIKGLECLQQLVTLDLSNNRITTIQGLSCCPLLETVNMSRNALATTASIEHFQQCPNLKNIDLTNNRLECDEAFFPCLAAIPSLVTLSLNGNELTKFNSFRKRMVNTLPKLGYLDRPIDELERLCAEAYFAGGPDAEKAARDQHREMQTKKRTDEMAVFRQWQKDQAELRAQARAEGRSLMVEVSEEELEERRAEARRDAEEEKRILSLGVDKLAARYWQLEAAGGGGGSSSSGNGGGGSSFDPLEEAGRALLEEQAALAEPSEPSSRVTELDADDDDTDAHFNTSTVWRRAAEAEAAAAATQSVPSPTGSATEESKSFDPALLPAPPARVSSSATVAPPAPPAPAPAAASDLQEQEQSGEKVDPREEYERQKRVADSMAIYKRQLAVAKAAGRKLTLGTGVSELLAEHGATAASLTLAQAQAQGAAAVPETISPKVTSTWEDAAALTRTDQATAIAAAAAAAPGPAASAKSEGKTYWSEDLDIALAKEVRSKMFDFDAVSAALIAASGPGGKLEKSSLQGGAGLGTTEKLSSEACRLRWAELDAERWSVAATTSTPMDTNFQVYVTPSMISAAQGHGGQPSYQALATMAAGSMPTYLTVPTAFPSVADIDDEDEDDDVQVFSVPPPPIPVNLEAMD